MCKTFQKMSTTEIKHRIIDKLLSIDNDKLLMALNAILENKPENIITLTKEQKKILTLSSNDILNGNMVSQKELNIKDKKWLD